MGWLVPFQSDIRKKRMSKDSLFTPLQLGAIKLPNRIAMAPLTRMRAGADNVPTALNAMYYAQRASAGVIITEGTAISVDAHGYPSAPGIYTAAQIAGWRLVTDGVHARGGRIIMQIAHNGRNSHSSLRPNGSAPVAPSAVPPTIPALTMSFQQVKSEIPRSLEIPEISDIVGEFRQAALNAMEAGFDGIELQGANSHLIEEFLEDGTNTRTDQYGGSQENRARFLLEIVEQVGAAIGVDRLGVRLSPFGQYGGIHDSSPKELFSFVIRELDKRHIAYLHLIEARGSEMGLTDELHENAVKNAELFRPLFSGPLLSAAAYTPDSAALAIEQKHADAIVFGRLFIANPDLVERIRGGYPLNRHDRSTFYGGAEHGYTDYKTFGEAA
jgi:N-ethylmaleimide reductase